MEHSPFEESLGAHGIADAQTLMLLDNPVMDEVNADGTALIQATAAGHGQFSAAQIYTPSEEITVLPSAPQITHSKIVL